MKELAVFIDLNTYRITNAMLDDIHKFSQKYDKVTYNYYNYSPLLHKSLNIHGTTYNTLSGRRKVQIDIRIICDALEYACINNGGNVLLLCGIIDSKPLFDKLKQLGTRIFFATMQKVDVGATEYVMLSREISFARPQQVNVISVPALTDSVNNYIEKTKAKTLITTSINNQSNAPILNDEYDTQLQELNLLINKLKY